MMVVYGTDGIISAASSAYVEASGYTKEELIGQKISILRYHDLPGEFFSELWETIRSGKIWEGEVKKKKKDGGFYYLEQKIIPIVDACNEITSYLAICNDVTQKKEAEYLSTVDKLTDTYNRRTLDHYMHCEFEKAKRYAHSLTFILLDVDYFKSINDTYGHLIGDTILQTISEILKQILRKSDIFGRYGGDEFLIICSQADENAAVTLAYKIKQQIENYLFPHTTSVTLSLGIAEYRDEETPEALFHRADQALYLAKNDGRNCIKINRK